MGVEPLQHGVAHPLPPPVHAVYPDFTAVYSESSPCSRYHALLPGHALLRVTLSAVGREDRLSRPEDLRRTDPRTRPSGSRASTRAGTQADPAPDLVAGVGMAGAMSSATIRSDLEGLAERQRRPLGPVSDFHGSTVSSSALVSRIRRHVDSSADGVTRRSRPSTASVVTVAATAASRLSGAGAGPTPLHLLADHGGHPSQQVAEVVGQIGVVAGGRCPRQRSRRRSREGCPATGGTGQRPPRSRR